MPAYLDNNIFQGAGNASASMGDAFTRAIVGTQQMRYQQQQAQQQQAMEAARLELERQRLLQQTKYDQQHMEMQRPLIQAQTSYYKAGADLDKQKLTQGQTQMDLGNLVSSALRAQQMIRNPGEGGNLPITPQLAQALGPGQFSQADMLSRLSGIIGGAGGQVSMQAPASAVGNLAQAQYMQTPEGLRDVAVGAPQKQGMTPEQQVMSSLFGKIISAKMKPTTSINIKGERTQDVDESGTIALANAVSKAMFGTNALPSIETEETTPNGFVAPTAPSAPTGGAGLPNVTSKEQRDALPPGSKYLYNGVTYTKGQ